MANTDFINPYHLTVPFGPYQGQSLGYIRDEHPRYLESLALKTSIPEWWRMAAAYLGMKQPIPASLIPTSKPVPKKIPDRDAKVAFYLSEREIAIHANLTDKEQEEFKTVIDGPHFDVDAGYWRVTTPNAIAAIEYFGGPKKIAVDPKVKELCLAQHRRWKAIEAIRQKTDSELKIPGFIRPLLPSQKVDVEFGLALNGRFLIAHETGGGKTISALAFAMYTGDKTLIVVPNKLKVRWYKAIKEFLGQEACMWEPEGMSGDKFAQFHLINYDLVEKFRFKLADLKFACLIADECSALKNHKSGRTKSIMGKWDERKLYPGIPTKHVVLLSATYLENKPIEIFTLFHFLDPDNFVSPVSFEKRYGDGVIFPYQNLDELHKRVNRFVIRRSMAEISGEMPKVVRNNLWIELTEAERNRYKKAEENMFKKWKTLGQPSAAQIPMLRHALFSIKAREVIEFVEHTGRPFLIFVIHPEHAEKLAEHWGTKARVITGKMNAKQAQASVDDLVAGKANYGVFTLGAAAKGLDELQKRFADVFIMDRWWVPAAHEQAEGRARRMGQKDQVRSWYATTLGTYDEYLAECTDEKQAYIDTIVDGKQHDVAAKESVFSDFVHKLRQHRHLEELRTSTIDDSETLG